MDRYQGIVALDGESLVDAALTYFRQSEQLPTFMRLAVARHYWRAKAARSGTWHWRAGGLMIQQLRARRRQAQVQRRRARTMPSWRRTTRTGSGTRSSPRPSRTTSCSTRCWRRERLLYRLFHEEGVRALPPSPVEAYCRCSRERVEAFLRSFGAEELADMHEPDGGISVTCEFCATKYRFEPGEIA